MANPAWGSRKKDSPLYWVWQNMKRRCNNPDLADSSRYHGRGVRYCERWEVFDNFHEDMASTYKIGLTLDRIDNDGNYEPNNCRWATMKEQSNNRCSTRYFTIDGVTKTEAQWIDEASVKPSTIRQRFYGYGWDFKRSLLTPTRPRSFLTN